MARRGREERARSPGRVVVGEGPAQRSAGGVFRDLTGRIPGAGRQVRLPDHAAVTPGDDRC